MQKWLPGCPQPPHGSHLSGALLHCDPLPQGTSPPPPPPQTRLPGRDVQAIPGCGLATGYRQGRQRCCRPLHLPTAPKWASRAVGQSPAWDTVTPLGCWLGAAWAERWGAMGQLPSPLPWGSPLLTVQVRLCCSSGGGGGGVFWRVHPTRTRVSQPSAHHCRPGGGPRGHPPPVPLPPLPPSLRCSGRFQRTPVVTPRTALWGN